MILRFLNIQGIAGLALSACLGVLLFLEKSETRRWRQQSGRLEQLYRKEQAAFATTVANYRTAADQARSADRATAERVAAEQRTISERTNDEFKVRVATARAVAQRLRIRTAGTAADPSDPRAAPVPGLPAAAGRPRQAANQDGLSPQDRLIATEQAIQLDELIKWVEAQGRVQPNSR
jgi:hypothetical protein